MIEKPLKKGGARLPFYATLTAAAVAGTLRYAQKSGQDRFRVGVKTLSRLEKPGQAERITETDLQRIGALTVGFDLPHASDSFRRIYPTETARLQKVLLRYLASQEKAVALLPSQESRVSREQRQKIRAMFGSASEVARQLEVVGEGAASERARKIEQQLRQRVFLYRYR